MPTIEQLQRLHEDDPKDTFVLYAMAQERAKHGGHDEAIGWYTRCLGIDPDYLYAYFHMARSLEACDMEAEAIEALREGLKRAISAGDAQARSEIQGYLDTISP